MRRTELKRNPPAKIRQLGPSDPMPSGDPKRYRDGRGYIRLRWLVGPNEYVEIYEHRLVMGRPPLHLEVHHRNGNKADNRKANLQLLTKREHAELHGSRATRRPPEETVRGAKAARAAARRDEVRGRALEMAELYRAGLTTTEIGAKVGCHSATVSRALRSVGVLMRLPSAQAASSWRATKQLVDARAKLRCERCNRSVKYEAKHHHHRRPRGSGGSVAASTNQPANVLLLCVPCHVHVESNRAEALHLGYLVPQGTDPATIPVLYNDGSLWLLEEDGSKTFLQVAAS